MAKKLGEMWNNLSDSKKQPYINKAAKLKEKYEKVRDQSVPCTGWGWKAVGLVSMPDRPSILVVRLLTDGCV